MAAFSPDPCTRLWAGMDDVQDGIRDEKQLLDVRSSQQFDSTVRRSRRAGRVPGALNVPYKQLLAEDGNLLPPDALQDALEHAGLDLSREVIIYCNGGVSACVAGVALESIGHRQWRVYDGSWNEYGNRDDVAIQCDARTA
jgi:thiosulfate/3-mercaptopyruvate sulfurtransferase